MLMSEFQPGSFWCRRNSSAECVIAIVQLAYLVERGYNTTDRRFESSHFKNSKDVDCNKYFYGRIVGMETLAWSERLKWINNCCTIKISWSHRMNCLTACSAFWSFFRTIFADVVNTTHKIFFVNFEIIF